MSDDTPIPLCDCCSMSAGRLRRAHWVLLLLFSGALFLVNLGRARALTKHEVLLAAVAKRMVQDREWVLLRIGDEYFLEKPPLPHWLAAASSWALGGFTETSVRLPSALCGAGVVLIVAWIATRLFGPKIGFLSGLVQAGSQYMIAYARLAEADMPLLLIVMGAFAVFVRIQQLPDDAPKWTRRCWTVFFWGLIGLTNLAKGPLFGAVLVLLSCCGWLTVGRQWRKLRQLLVSPTGILLAASLTLIWPVLVVMKVPEALDLWNSHLFGRAAGQLGYNQPFYYYLTTWPWQLLPWTPFLFVGTFESFRRARKNARSSDAFVWWWALSQAVFLSLSRGKHHHYLIYALPALSPVIAMGLVRYASYMTGPYRFPLWGGRFLKWAVPPISVATLAALAAASRLPRGDTVWLGVIVAGGSLAVGTFGLRKRPVAALASFLVVVVLGNAYAQMVVLPRRDSSRADREYLMEVDRKLPPGTPVLSTREDDVARHMFYLHRPVQGVCNPQDLGRLLNERECSYVAARNKDAPLLRRSGRVTRLEQSRFTRRERSPADRFALFRVERRPSVATGGPNAGGRTFD